MKFYQRMIALFLLTVFVLSGCAAQPAPDQEKLPTSPQENGANDPDNLPMAKTDQEENADKTPENLQSDEEITLNPCIDQSVHFTSFQEMETQIGAMSRLAETDERYATYAPLNASSVDYYYVPKNLSGYTLVDITMLPHSFIYTYVQDSTGAKVVYDLVRVWEEDPLADIEKRYEQLRFNGYLGIGQYNRYEMYSTIDDHYLTCVEIDHEWFEAQGIESGSYRYHSMVMSQLRPVRFSGNLVTE